MEALVCRAGRGREAVLKYGCLRRLLLVRGGLELDAERREETCEGAVDGIEELAPELDRQPRDVRRRDAAAETCACLEHVHVQALRGELDGRREPRDATADDHDVVLCELRHR